MVGPEDSAPASRKRFRASLAVSLALHAAVIFILLPSAYWITRTQLAAQGDYGASAREVFVALRPSDLYAPPLPKAQRAQNAKLQFAEREKFSNRFRTATQAPQKPRNLAETAGARYGTALTGSLDEIYPALPVLAPDPPVLRAPLPPGVQGDVIVEVTIDAHGNVTQTRLLQGMGYGVVPVIISTLEGWRFKPAMRDGIPIASRQDVHFHLPS